MGPTRRIGERGMVSSLTIDMEQSAAKIEEIEKVIDDVKSRIDKDVTALCEAFKILTQHHLIVHKDCELLEDF